MLFLITREQPDMLVRLRNLITGRRFRAPITARAPALAPRPSALKAFGEPVENAPIGTLQKGPADPSPLYELVRHVCRFGNPVEQGLRHSWFRRANSVTRPRRASCRRLSFPYHAVT